MARHHRNKKKFKIPKGEIWRGKVKKMTINGGGLTPKSLQNGALRFDDGIIRPVTVRLIGGMDEIVVDKPTHENIMKARERLFELSLVDRKVTALQITS